MTDKQTAEVSLKALEAYELFKNWDSATTEADWDKLKESTPGFTVGLLSGMYHLFDWALDGWAQSSGLYHDELIEALHEHFTDAAQS